MSGLNINQATRPQPRHPLYVSIQNGVIHQAMSSPSGYEDEHPEDWRPATHLERAQYLAGVDNINGNPQPEPLPMGVDAGTLATPQTLTLQADDPVPVTVVMPGMIPIPNPPVVEAHQPPTPVGPVLPAAAAPAVDGALSVGAPPPPPPLPPAAPPPPAPTE